MKKKAIFILICILMIFGINYSLLYEEKNIFKAEELPSNLLEQGSLKEVSGSVQGWLTYGPYASLEAGEYKIEIVYLTSGDSNYAQVFSLSQNAYYTQENFAEGENRLILRLSLKQKIKDLEVRTWYAGDGMLQIESISIAKAFPWKQFLLRCSSMLAICLLIVALTDKKVRVRLLVKQNLVAIIGAITIIFLHKTTVDQMILQMKYTNFDLWKETGTAGYLGMDLYETIVELLPKSKVKYITEVKDFMNSRTVQAYEYETVKEVENIVLIQLEGVDSVCIDMQKDGKYIMENVQRLKNSGIWFPNVYDQTGSGRTSDGEFLALTSLLPIEGESMYTHYDLEKLDSLPRLLKAQGMATAAFHGNTASYWNRKNAHSALGYEQGYYKEEIKKEIEKKYYGWGLSDGTVLQKTGEILLTNEAKTFTHTVLLTGHHPYDAVNKMDIDLPYPNPASTIENYVNCLFYTDCAVGKLVAELQQAELLEKTLIVIFADHDSGITSLVYEYMNLPYTATDVNCDKIPLIIYDGRNQYVEEEIMGQADITPLILSYIGLELPEYIMGLNYVEGSKVVYLQKGTITGEKGITDNKFDLGMITKAYITWGGEIANE